MLPLNRSWLLKQEEITKAKTNGENWYDARVVADTDKDGFPNAVNDVSIGIQPINQVPRKPHSRVIGRQLGGREKTSQEPD